MTSQYHVNMISQIQVENVRAADERSGSFICVFHPISKVLYCCCDLLSGQIVNSVFILEMK